MKKIKKNPISLADAYSSSIKGLLEVIIIDKDGLYI
jgi:hypothetical protein